MVILFKNGERVDINKEAGDLLMRAISEGYEGLISFDKMVAMVNINEIVYIGN